MKHVAVIQCKFELKFYNMILFNQYLVGNLTYLVHFA